MARVLAVGALCAVLLSGCGRGMDRKASHDAPVAPQTTSAPTGAPATGTGTTGTGTGSTGASSANTQISSVDSLLNDLDNQVNSDSQPQPDAD